MGGTTPWSGGSELCKKASYIEASLWATKHHSFHGSCCIFSEEGWGPLTWIPWSGVMLCWTASRFAFKSLPCLHARVSSCHWPPSSPSILPYTWILHVDLWPHLSLQRASCHDFDVLCGLSKLMLRLNFSMPQKSLIRSLPPGAHLLLWTD